jgi:hypothetical protein
MSTDDRFSEDENKRFHRMKPCAEDTSKASSTSDVLKGENIKSKTGTKAYSVNYTTINECHSILIEQRQLKVDQAGFSGLIDDLYRKLDCKEIQDIKDRSWRKKYRERAKVCMLDLYEIGRAEFIIDSSDIDDKSESLLSELDEDSREYVIREVISRIFASIGVPYFKLTQKYCVFNTRGSSVD